VVFWFRVMACMLRFCYFCFPVLVICLFMILGVECDFTLMEGHGSTRGNNFYLWYVILYSPSLFLFFFSSFFFSYLNFFPSYINKRGVIEDILLLLYREIQPLLNVVAFDLFLCRVAERQHIFCGGSGSG